MSRNVIEEINAFYQIRGKKKTKNFYCNYCGEEIQSEEELFIDVLGYTFCNRECFYKSKRFRDPQLFLL